MGDAAVQALVRVVADQLRPHRQLAVIEMAEASGLWRLRAEERDPLRANTFGTGQLLLAAARHGVERIILGIGGSATNDAGIGCACVCRHAGVGR